MSSLQISFLNLLLCIFPLCAVFSQNAYPRAEKGVIDLRTFDFTKKEQVELSGEWHFLPGEFAQISGFKDIKPQARLLMVPGSWETANSAYQTGNTLVHGTYILRVLLPTDKRHSFSLFVKDQSQPYSLFWNNRVLPTPGKPGKLEQESQPRSLPARYFLPDPTSEENLVVFHISNFHAAQGGLVNPIFIGLSSAIKDQQTIRFAYEALSAGFIFLFMIHHLIMYLFRRTEKSYLFLSFSFVFAALFILNSGEKILPYFFPFLDHTVHIPLQLASGIWSGYFFLKYAEQLHEKKLLQIITLFSLICAVLYTLLLMFIPIKIFLAVFTGYATLLITFMALTVFISVLSDSKIRKSEKILLLSGTAFIVAALLSDRYGLSITGFRFLPLGILLFFLLHIIALSLSLSATFHQTELYKTELKNYAENLEKMVEARTSELRRERKISEDSNTLKDKFIGIISHDLRSPLSGISGLLNVLEDPDGKLSETEKKEILQVAGSSVQEVLRMTEDLLTLNRFTSGKIQPVMADFDLHLLTDSILKKNSGQAYLKNLHMVNQIDEKFIIRADPLLLEQVLMNLVSNSIKFSRNKGVVTISASRDEHRFLIKVSDTGQGIPPEILPDLFNPAVKTVRSGTGGEKGTGLGLVICREIMRTHGGEIIAESTTAAGTTFTLVLPIKDATHQVSEEYSIY